MTQGSHDHDRTYAGANHAPDEPAFGADWWERHYQDGDAASLSHPSPYVTDEIDDLAPGSVLDAGCGTGADAIWLASRGWDVTAVDVSPTAIERARHRAGELAGKITWVVADLNSWDAPKRYDLVITQYVHPDQPFGQFLERLGCAVVPGGTLLVVGHDHADPLSAASAPSDASINATKVAAVLDRNQWAVETADVRTRDVIHEGNTVSFVDIIVKARRNTEC